MVDLCTSQFLYLLHGKTTKNFPIISEQKGIINLSYFQIKRFQQPLKVFTWQGLGKGCSPMLVVKCQVRDIIPLPIFCILDNINLSQNLQIYFELEQYSICLYQLQHLLTRQYILSRKPPLIIYQVNVKTSLCIDRESHVREAVNRNQSLRSLDLYSTVL